MGDRFPSRERRKPVRLQEGVATAKAPQPRAAKKARLTMQDIENNPHDEGGAAGLVELRQQAGCEAGPASQAAGTAQAAAGAGAAAGATTKTPRGMTLP